MCEIKYGIDSLQSINALADLAKLYFKTDMKEKAVESLLKAIYLSDIVGGEYVNDSFLSLVCQFLDSAG